MSGTIGRRFAGSMRGVGSSRPDRPRPSSLGMSRAFSALGRGRPFVPLVVVALLFCHGAFGYAHQLPPVGAQTPPVAHAAHAGGDHQPGQDQTVEGLHLQGGYFATLLLLLFGAALLAGGGLPAGAKLAVPTLLTGGNVRGRHPPRGPTLSRLQVFRL